MSIDALKERLSRIEELPSLPTIVAEINELLSNPKASAKQLAVTIMRDPAITAKVLKISNSAFFGFAQPITSVNQAIVALGFNTVRSIVLCSSVIEAFSGDSKFKTFNRREFWVFSVAVGAAARVVARNAKAPKLENAFVAGLLHGVGKIIFDEYFHEPFMRAVEKSKAEQMSWWEAEKACFGITDAVVSGVMLQIWKLSDDLALPVMYQEDPFEAPEEHRANAAFVLVGNVLARTLMVGDPGDILVPALSPEVLELAGVEPSQWRRLIELSVDGAAKAKIFMD